jgi:hypothetical protein
MRELRAAVDVTSPPEPELSPHALPQGPHRNRNRTDAQTVPDHGGPRQSCFSPPHPQAMRRYRVCQHGALGCAVDVAHCCRYQTGNSPDNYPVRTWLSILRPLGCPLNGLLFAAGFPAVHPDADGSRLASAGGLLELRRRGDQGCWILRPHGVQRARATAANWRGRHLLPRQRARVRCVPLQPVVRELGDRRRPHTAHTLGLLLLLSAVVILCRTTHATYAYARLRLHTFV